MFGACLWSDIDTTCSSLPELWPPDGSVRGRGKVLSPNQWPSGSARCRRQWDRTAPKPCPPGSAQNTVKSATRAVHLQTKSKSSTYIDISVVNEHTQRRENLYEDRHKIIMNKQSHLHLLLAWISSSWWVHSKSLQVNMRNTVLVSRAVQLKMAWLILKFCSTEYYK